MATRHSIFCILPPYILQEIAQRGTPEQRVSALQTLNVSQQIRSNRQTLTEFAALRSVSAAAGKHRTIYDANFGQTLPGVIVRNEGDGPSADPAVNEAYDGSGVTYDLYHDIFQRDSIDNAGMRLDSSVHYQRGYDNAFWDGNQMVYGDGDENLPPLDRLFNRFTIAIDIIGHELTHGVTQFEARLVYWEQPGALNESFSDVFGSLVKQYQLQHTAAQADWTIGQGLFTANVQGVGIRSMKEPGSAYDDPVIGKDPQPGHMRDYVQTSSDNGGVHINSGIPNKAFYRTAMEIGGYAWEKAGHIWYTTLRDKLQAQSTFVDAARLTFETAGELSGENSLEQQAVKKGWSEVGIEIGGETPPPAGDGCLTQVLRALGLVSS
jgi:Zn-dependent metalloprotease